MSGEVQHLPQRQPAGDYLGPARVCESEPGSLMLTRSDGVMVAATLALALPYAPAEGDTLLVIGKGADHYVIGVIDGAGKHELRFAGDVDLHASGALTLSADREVAIRGPRVDVVTSRFKVLAGSVIERFGSLSQRVLELLDVRAGEAQTIVEGSSVQRARDTTILSAETTAIDGKTVLLG